MAETDLEIEERVQKHKRVRRVLDMPRVGYGTYRLGDETESCVLAAIRCGYRLIDTAQVYGNEKSVGTAIMRSEIPREEIFVTSKVLGVWRPRFLG